MNPKTGLDESGKEYFKSGNTVESVTQVVSSRQLNIGNRQINLYDVPGLEDPTRDLISWVEELKDKVGTKIIDIIFFITEGINMRMTNEKIL